MKKISILQIAERMNLSRNTVAKALNGGHVSIETRMEVVEMAQKMGYSKLDEKLLLELESYQNAKCTEAVLVLYQKWESLRLTGILEGIKSKAREAGLKTKLGIIDENNQDANYALSLLGKEVVGIIFLGVFEKGFVETICKEKRLVTFFNTPVNAEAYIELGDVYSLEGFYSMNKLISHCIEQKHCQSFMFIGDAEGSRGVQARMLGFLSACGNHGIKINDTDLYTRPDKSKYFDYDEIAGILGKLPQLPNAVICENDEVAQSVALWANKNDIQNGLNTIITGFEGTIPKDFCRNDILTVEVRMEELGKRLVASIVERRENSRQDKAFVTIATYPKINE